MGKLAKNVVHANNAVTHALKGNVGKTIAKEAGSALGGISGADIGGALAAGAAVAVGQPELAPVAAMGGAYVGGQIGSMVGRQAGHRAYKSATGRKVKPLKVTGKTFSGTAKTLASPVEMNAFASGEMGGEMAASAAMAAGQPELAPVAKAVGSYAVTRGIEAAHEHREKLKFPTVKLGHSRHRKHKGDEKDSDVYEDDSGKYEKDSGGDAGGDDDGAVDNEPVIDDSAESTSYSSGSKTGKSSKHSLLMEEELKKHRKRKRERMEKNQMSKATIRMPQS